MIMNIYLISDNKKEEKTLKEHIERQSFNKYDVIIVENYLDLDVTNCIGIILDTKMLSTIESEKFLLTFGSTPIVFYVEDLNKMRLNRNSISICKGRFNKFDIDKLLAYFERYSNLYINYIFVKDKKTFIKLFYDKVLYVYNEGNYICYFDESEKIYKKRGSVSDIIDDLPDYFVEITHHVFVNVYYITKLDISLKIVELKENIVLPVSNSKIRYLKSILRVLK